MKTYLIRVRGGNYLIHHGVKGQRWGVKNGPPYPLSRSRNGLDKPAGSADNIRKVKSRRTYTERKSETQKLPFRRLSSPESIADTVTKTNPNLGNPRYEANCTACAIAGYLRQHGYDVVAKDTGRTPRVLHSVVQECFKKSTTLLNTNGRFTKSRNSAADMLLEKYGNRAEGVCSFEWKSGGGHAINWKISNGNVAFYDSQQRMMPYDVHRKYWNKMKSEGSVQIIRLDNLEVKENGLAKYVENS